MSVASYRILAPGEFAHRAPVGGCWVKADEPTTASLASFQGGWIAGQVPDMLDRPAEFYPQGYPLPEGTTQYAQLWSATSHGRIIPYIPDRYAPRDIQRLRAIQRANAERVPGLLADGELEPFEVESYITNRGLTNADLRRLEAFTENNLRPGELYVGRPVQVIFNVGTIASRRRAMVRELWEDIELALEGT